MRKAATVLVVLLVARALSGCSLVQESPRERAQRIEPLLSAAGFHMHPADTPEKLDTLKSLTPLKVRYYAKAGQVHYWFADPVSCQCLFIGREDNYQKYQQLRLEERIANQEAEAAEMNEAAAQEEQMNFMMWPGDPFFY